MEKNSKFVSLVPILIIICIIGVLSYVNKVNYYQRRYEQCRQLEEELIKENGELKSELLFYKRQLENIDSTVWGYIYRKETSSQNDR